LQVPTVTREAGMSFSDGQGARTLTTPPTNARTLFTLVSSPQNLLWSTSLYWFLRSGLPLVAAQDWRLSLRDYLVASRIPLSVQQNYLVPALAAFWGAPVADMPDFPAYDVLRVMQQGKFGTPYFSFVEGGASTYARTVREQSPAVRVETGAPVRRLRRDEQGWMVLRDSGEEGPFDQVIVATPSYVVEALLGDHPLARVAAGFRHFPTQIVIHRDPAQMPRDHFRWTNLNVRFDGTHAWTTEWAGRDLRQNVFRTWLPPGHPEPAQVEHRRTFRHLLVDGQSRTRQLEIAQLQGRDGVFLAGMYTCDVDNHESVAASAVAVAERLSPESPQLAQLHAQLGTSMQPR
ncbi:MAG TPA: FAD-dependent oxidoreductase, partial [Myxococcota bacterium]|nr:FAD-dependent oxidoreductase [Myxococcota bacterium]